MDVVIDGYKISGKIKEGSMLIAENKLGNKRVLKPYKADLKICFSVAEFEILKKLEHKNILTPLELFEKSGQFYAVYDYLKADNLVEYLRKKINLSEEEVYNIIKSIIDGYSILRDKNLIHGNIKPENILIEKGNKPTIKLTDFLIREKMTWKGEQYCSPEIIKGLCPPNVVSDIWSIGSVIKLIIENTRPYNRFFSDLIEQCLQKDTKKRVQFDEILVHPNFTSVNYIKTFAKTIYIFALAKRVSQLCLVVEIPSAWDLLCDWYTGQNSKQIANFVKLRILILMICISLII